MLFRLRRIFFAVVVPSLVVLARPVLAATTQPAVPLKGLTIQAGTPSASKSPPRLQGRDARMQLLVTAEILGGQLRDYTRNVEYDTKPAGLVQMNVEPIPILDSIVIRP